MSIAKLLTATAIAAAPISFLSAQGTAPADSGSHHAHEWLAGTGAAAGAGLFLAFTHSGNNSSANGTQYSFHTPTTPPVNNPGPTPTGGSTPPPSHEDTTATPPDTGTVNTPNPTNNPPVVNDGNPPSNDNPVGPNDDPPPNDGPVITDVSTVPEPGSAALLATGIIGLVPLLRKRRK